MDFDIAMLVTQDGISNGAIYAMMALGMVLIFNSTRIIFVPFGDLAAYAALTLGFFQLHQRPGTIWLVLVLSLVAFAIEATELVLLKATRRIWRPAFHWLALPCLPSAGPFIVPPALPPSAPNAPSGAVLLSLRPPPFPVLL